MLLDNIPEQAILMVFKKCINKYLIHVIKLDSDSDYKIFIKKINFIHNVLEIDTNVKCDLYEETDDEQYIYEYNIIFKIHVNIILDLYTPVINDYKIVTTTKYKS